MREQGGYVGMGGRDGESVEMKHGSYLLARPPGCFIGVVLYPGWRPEALPRATAMQSLRDITEYGRVVHAEMEALLSCACNNVDCRWDTLYCSTFPCHNCAKHLIAAGIKRVVYVEPYPKSKALPFHDDSITLGFQDDNENLNKVRFEPFVGVGPRNFLNLFSIGIGKGYEIPRKKDGQILKWDRKSARLRMEMNPYSYLDRETDAVKELDDCLKRKGVLTKDAQ